MGAQVRKLPDDDLANIDKFTAALKNLSTEAMVAGGKLISGTAVPVAEMKSWWDRTQDELVDMMVPSLLGDKVSKVQQLLLGRKYDQAQQVADAASETKAAAMRAGGATGGIVNYGTMDAMSKAGMSSGLISGLASRQRMIEYASSHRGGLVEQSQALQAKGAAFDAMSLKSRDLRSIGTPDNFTAKRVDALEGLRIDMGILANAATQTGVKVIPQNSD
jgi:hypothetical protein